MPNHQADHEFSAKHFYQEVRNFEATCETQLRQTLLKMQQTRDELQHQAGVVEANEQYLQLLTSALRGILDAETSDQVKVYQASINYLLDTAHPETAIMPINQRLESFLQLTDLYEDRLDAETTTVTDATLKSFLEKLAIEEQQFAKQIAALLNEFNAIVNKNNTAIKLLILELNHENNSVAKTAIQDEIAALSQSNNNYRLGLKKINNLQTQMTAAHQLVTNDLPQVKNFQHHQDVRQELHRMIDNLHHTAAVDKQASEDFLDHRSQSKKIVTVLCDVRTAYLKTEQDRHNEFMLKTAVEAGWQTVQFASGIPAPGLEYAAPVLAAADSVKTGKESKWRNMLLSAAGFVISIALLAFLPTAALGIAGLVASCAGAAYALKEIKKTSTKEIRRNNSVANQLDKHQAALDNYRNSIDINRQQRANVHQQLSTEAKIEKMLMGHKNNETMAPHEISKFAQAHEKLLQNETIPDKSITSPPLVTTSRLKPDLSTVIAVVSDQNEEEEPHP